MLTDASVRMPHAFLPPTKTSLTHLMRASLPQTRPTASQTATAAADVMPTACAAV